jgi:hypothetical protein
MKRSLVFTSIIFFLVSWSIFGKAEEKPERVRSVKPEADLVREEKPERIHPVKPEADLVRPGKPATIPTEFHYTGKYCEKCHSQTPKRGGKRFLKFDGDYNLLCKCHLKAPDSYIHPTGITPSDEKKTKIPADFPLEDGKVTCLTCHDLYRQCQEQSVDKHSLRGVPYRKATDFCFKCHDQKSYVQLNPHNTQLDEKGKIVTDICLYCHTEVPKEKQARLDDSKLVGDLEVLCQRCHFHMARQMKSQKFSHMIKPTVKTRATMKKMEEELKIVLPLDAEGKTTCATCHNPHEKGVISAESPAATGAGANHRLRLPEPPCIACHEQAIRFKQ